jgi:O-antigen ligase
MWAAIAAAAVVSAVALIGFGETSALYPGRVALFGDNPIWTARAAFVGALVMTFGPFPRIIKVIATPILILAGILTVSLGPLLGFAIGIWAGAAEILRTSVRTADRRQLGWIALGLVSGIGVIGLLANSLFGGENSILASVVVNDPNVTGRATFLDAALRMFLSSPFLGVGLGGFESTGLIQYPHNLVAEIGSELGVAGLLALAAWVVIALRGAAGSPILVALLIATAVFSLFSGSVASNAEFWLVSALAVAKVPVRARSRSTASDTDREPLPSAAPVVAIGR